MPTVLVVEDEGISRRALVSLLAASGYKAIAFGSAEEALQEAEERSIPRLALVDVDLPGMNGLDLIARLSQLRPDLYAVLITAVEGDRIKRFRATHTVGYLRKPLDVSRLLELLTNSQPSA